VALFGVGKENSVALFGTDGVRGKAGKKVTAISTGTSSTMKRKRKLR